MGIVSWIIMGALVGLLATLTLPGRFPLSIAGMVLGGMVGAFLAGGAFSVIAGRGVAGFDLVSLLIALVGASALLILLRALGLVEGNTRPGGTAAGSRA